MAEALHLVYIPRLRRGVWLDDHTLAMALGQLEAGLTHLQAAADEEAARQPEEETRLANLLREARIMIDDLNRGYPSKELHRTPEDLIAAIDEGLGE